MQALCPRPGRLGHHQSKSPEGPRGPEDLRLGFPGGPWACSLSPSLPHVGHLLYIKQGATPEPNYFYNYNYYSWNNFELFPSVAASLALHFSLLSLKPSRHLGWVARDSLPACDPVPVWRSRGGTWGAPRVPLLSPLPVLQDRFGQCFTTRVHTEALGEGR